MNELAYICLLLSISLFETAGCENVNGSHLSLRHAVDETTTAIYNFAQLPNKDCYLNAEILIK